MLPQYTAYIVVVYIYITIVSLCCTLSGYLFWSVVGHFRGILSPSKEYFKCSLRHKLFSVSQNILDDRDKTVAWSVSLFSMRTATHTCAIIQMSTSHKLAKCKTARKQNRSRVKVSAVKKRYTYACHWWKTHIFGSTALTSPRSSNCAYTSLLIIYFSFVPFSCLNVV